MTLETYLELLREIKTPEEIEHIRVTANLYGWNTVLNEQEYAEWLKATNGKS